MIFFTVQDISYLQIDVTFTGIATQVEAREAHTCSKSTDASGFFLVIPFVYRN